MRNFNDKYAAFTSYRRIWAVAAVHGDKDRLSALHDHLATRFAIRDRLIYLGNYVGASASPKANAGVMEELLAFRSALLAKTGMEPTDIVHLRGPAEEAWQRLLRLQFTPSPCQVLERLLEAGAESYLRLYGVSLNDARGIARAGSVAITRWTNQLRTIQRQAEGHEPLTCSMKRAAYATITGDKADSAEADEQKLLFVPAGFDPRLSLDNQADGLWFGTGTQAQAIAPEAAPYQRIVRGFDPARRGVNTDDYLLTLDAGAGHGGPLVCGCFDETGHLSEIITIGGRGAVETMPVRASARGDEAKAPRSLLAPLPLASFWGDHSEGKVI